MAHLVDELRQYTVVERESGNTETGRDRGVSVHHGFNVVTPTENSKVHVQLARWRSVPSEAPAGKIDLDDIVWSQPGFEDATRSHECTVGTGSDCDVSIGAGYQPRLV